MFNIGFSELILVLLIAFLVVGPRDLPKVARFLGRCVKWVRSIIAELKAETGWDDVMRETGDIRDDVQKALKQADIRQELKSAGVDLRKNWKSAEKETFRAGVKNAKHSVSRSDASAAESEARDNEPAAETSAAPGHTLKSGKLGASGNPTDTEGSESSGSALEAENPDDSQDIPDAGILEPESERTASNRPPEPSQDTLAPRSWGKYKENARLNQERLKEDSSNETGND